MDNVLDVLRERGFVHQVSEENELHARLEQPITLYLGYDATATSLHIGHQLSLMMLSWFQRYGHRPIALAGGGTTLIGDPTGKTASRPILTPEEIEENLRSMRPQLERFLDFREGRALAVNNADWLVPLSFIGFMREIGSRFTVNQILDLEAYRTRLEKGGLSFLEFSYVLVQSYDFLHLYKEYDCILQVGGSDQWGNSIAGADLVRRVTGGQAFVLVTPLITTGAGGKMGKSERGSVWLDPRMTSPYDYYQYWRNVDDSKVEQLLGIFTFLPMEEVRALGRLEGVELNRAKEVLAFEATKIVHGEEEARRAQEAAHALFTGAGDEESIPTVEIDRRTLADGLPVTALFKAAGLVPSTNEARRLIQQRGLSINGEVVTDPNARIGPADIENGHIMLRAGRKNYKRVVLV